MVNMHDNGERVKILVKLGLHRAMTLGIPCDKKIHGTGSATRDENANLFIRWTHLIWCIRVRITLLKKNEEKPIWKHSVTKILLVCNEKSDGPQDVKLSHIRNSCFSERKGTESFFDNTGESNYTVLSKYFLSSKRQNTCILKWTFKSFTK